MPCLPLFATIIVLFPLTLLIVTFAYGGRSFLRKKHPYAHPLVCSLIGSGADVCTECLVLSVGLRIDSAGGGVRGAVEGQGACVAVHEGFAAAALDGQPVLLWCTSVGV